MPLWILPRILSCAAQWGLGLSHLCKNKSFLYGRLFSKCCFQAAKLAGDLQCLRWASDPRLLCGFMGTGVSLDWAEIQSNILLFCCASWEGSRGRSHPFWAANPAHLVFPGCSGLCGDAVSRPGWMCHFSSAIILSINQYLRCWGCFSDSLDRVMPQCRWVNSCRVLSQLQHGPWERQCWCLGCKADGSTVPSED